MDTAFLEDGAAAPPTKEMGAGRAPEWWRQPRGVAFIVVVVTALCIGLGVGLGLDAEGGGGSSAPTMQPLPVVVSTWFAPAVQTAYDLLAQGYTALDAAELGCTYCEDARCDGTVGWGGSPDTNGETTLDAMIMDAETHAMGAVSYLRRVRHAIAAARKVMTYTEHTVLAGDGATNFSVLAMGLPEQDLTSDQSRWIQGNWTADKCQPNDYWNPVTVPASATGCAPYPVPVTPSYTPVYTPLPHAAAAAARASGAAALAAADRVPTAALPKQRSRRNPAGRTDDHDTIGMCTLDLGGKMAAGGSSNGATHKVPGRVSDISLPGAGAYVDRDGGCAAATGDGDITMRFLPAYQAVEYMRGGMHPQDACDAAVRRIMAYYGTNFHLGLVCLDKYGRVGGSSQGWTFTYAVAGGGPNATARVVQVPPLPALPGQ